MTLIRAAAIAALLAVLSGCPASTTPDAGSSFGCPVSCTSGLTCKNDRCVPTRCGGAGLGIGGPGCAEGQVCIDHYCSELGCNPPCPQGQTCSGQTCVPALPPSCQANTDCDTGESCVGGFCSQTGCTPACTSKDVCLDNLCIPPASGQTACAKPYQPCQNGDGPYCANLLTDSTNCGACGTTCPSGEVCNGSGVCAVTCIPSETKCQGSGSAICVNLQSDNQNCGQCGQACAAGQSCSAGACAATCAVPFATCGPAASIYCADLASDPSNCGGCGKACPVGGSCLDGGCAVSCPAPFVLCPSGNGYACADLPSAVANCGSCGNDCGATAVCFDGACAACGGQGQLSCPGNICEVGAPTFGVCPFQGSGSSSSGGSSGGSSSGGDGGLCFAGYVFEFGVDSDVDGASISALAPDGVAIPGAAAVAGVNGAFQFCFPASTTFSTLLTAYGYATEYLEELTVPAANALSSAPMFSNSTLEVWSGSIPGGLNSAQGMVLVEFTSSGNLSVPCASTSWTVAATLPGGGSPAYDVAYFGSGGTPDPSQPQTLPSGGLVLLYGIDPSLTDELFITASIVDAGSCTPISASYGLTGEVLVAGGALSVVFIVLP